MIGSISKQPDYKFYLSQQEVEKLIEGGFIKGNILDNRNGEKIELTIKQDSELLSGITKTGFNNFLISKNLLEELKEKGFIGGERLNGVTVKVILVVKERIDSLLISPDERDSIKWSLESIEDKLGL